MAARGGFPRRATSTPRSRAGLPRSVAFGFIYVVGAILLGFGDLRNLLGGMQPGTVLFFPLFDREHSLAKTSELGEFLLDGF
jgi:hypothetical protein